MRGELRTRERGRTGRIDQRLRSTIASALLNVAATTWATASTMAAAVAASVT